MLIRFYYFLCSSQGLSPVIYSINTSIAETTHKIPYEAVFGQQPRSDAEVWKIINKSRVESKEKISANFANIFDECKFYINYIFLESSSFLSNYNHVTQIISKKVI